MRAVLLALVLPGCTLVVGTAPQVDTDAGAGVDASDAQVATPDVSPPPPSVDAGKDEEPSSTCDVPGCNEAKDACKKTCADGAKTCNDMCNKGDEDGKSCHSLCAVQQASCNDACVQTCDQCVMGCGPPCPK